MGTRTEDVVEHLIIGSTHSHLLMFTNKGRLYEKKFYHIPDVGITGKGKNISGLINLQPDETVKAFLPVSEFIPGKYIVMVTKEGVIKKCELTEFDNIMTRGIIALSLDEGDELVSARLSTGEDLIFIATREGMSIKFPESDVRHMGRPARGVRGMALEEGDYVVAAEVVQDDALMLAISEMGYGKRTERVPATEPRRQGRHQHEDHQEDRPGGLGSERQEDSDGMLITTPAKHPIDSADIRRSAPTGVRLFRAGMAIRVAAACLVPDEGDAPVGDDAQGKLIE
jgi:DNA gyrase subunit A